jgi:hypothetical protein
MITNEIRFYEKLQDLKSWLFNDILKILFSSGLLNEMLEDHILKIQLQTGYC